MSIEKFTAIAFSHYIDNCVKYGFPKNPSGTSMNTPQLYDHFYKSEQRNSLIAHAKIISTKKVRGKGVKTSADYMMSGKTLRTARAGQAISSKFTDEDYRWIDKYGPQDMDNLATQKIKKRGIVD